MTRYERELRKLLTNLGYGVMRAPGSGAGGEQDLPDILAGEPAPGNDSHANPLCYAMAVEHKSTSGPIARASEEEIDALLRFCEVFGAAPFIGVRFTSQGTPTTHYFVEPGKARRTDQGNYAVDWDGIEDIASMEFHP